MKTSRHIAVIGAGLVGSLLARLLARRGHTVTVFEKRPDATSSAAPTGRSTHLVISARGWRALDAIEARSEVELASIPLFGRRTHLLHSSVLFHPYGAAGQSISAIHRGVLDRILVNLCARTPGVSLRFEQRCVDVDASSGRLTLENVRTGTSYQQAADYVFAADGAFSGVRTQMLRHSRLDFAQSYERFGYKELTLSAEQAQSLERDAMHAWPRGEVSLFGFPNLDGSFTATLLAPFDGPRGFGALRTPEDVTRLFKSSFPDVAPAALAEELPQKPTSSLVTIRCSPWTFGGRVALIGDSAHAMVPFLGQGMNAGFEDCTVLNELLDHFDDDFSLALGEYERARRPQADAVTTLSSRAFEELTAGLAAPRFQLKQKVEHALHRLEPERFVPPYQLIAFTNLPYVEVMRRIAEQDALVEQLVETPDILSASAKPSIEERVRALAHRAGGASAEAPAQPRPVLVSFKLCPFVQRAAIVLAEKRVEHDIRYIDLASPPDWFLDMSPLKRVPLLAVGEQVIFESAVISEFLDEAYAGRLHPEDPLERAKNRAWIEFGTECTFDAHRLAIQKSESDFIAAREAFWRKLDRLEAVVRGQPYFNGPNFSLVDSAFAPMLLRLDYLEPLGTGVFDDSRHPRLVAWKDGLLRHEAVRRATAHDLRDQYHEFLLTSGGYVAGLLRSQGDASARTNAMKSGGRNVGREVDGRTT